MDKGLRDTMIPAVTVIMPAYNMERFIETAIRSVMEQTFRDWKLLVIDDGSKDRTCAIVEQLAAEKELIALQEEAERLEVSLDAKYDLDMVEEIARNTYGMIDGAYVTQRYLTMSGSDTVETVEEEAEEPLFAALLSALGFRRGE